MNLSPRITSTIAALRPPDEDARAAALGRMNDKTKPRGSLGRLETLAIDLAGILRSPAPELPGKAIVVMGADHGVAAAGVSAYPPEVTAQMLLNFASGGAAINVLGRHAGARVIVIDMGTRVPPGPHPAIRDARVGAGTRDLAREAAMSRAEAMRAIEIGIGVAEELALDGAGLVGTGEMGIGNTTASSALTAALLGAPVAEVTGRGTGIDDERWRHKVLLIERAIARHAPHAHDAHDPLATLAALGGFEIAGLAGVVLGTAAAGRAVVVDGFIASTAALVATRLAPGCRPYLIAAHRSVESGHRLVLEALGQKPLLDLDMRLGEGTGAALAMLLCDAALKILRDMATFSDAKVSDSGA
jgi:nicotinate-nucleotide--dimethylbenzimidazole phosphoribosyltransferase